MNLLIFRAVVGGGNGIKYIAHVLTCVGGATASAAITMNSNGDMASTLVGSTSTDISPAFGALEWHEDNTSTTGADWEVFAELVSGTTPNGASVDTWVRLNANKSWSLTQTGDGTKTCTMTMSFRKFEGSGTVLKIVTGTILDVTVA